ncbi:MAG: molybdenum cofactor biosynthesis protein MoaE [Methanocorpusculum sp.]|nr:molybdenum cofactor biosynthesis protein MoaE [Methanocorpusculum sp.]
MFIGYVRDDGMDELEIEAFVPVAEKDLADIAAEAKERFHLNSVDVVHRYGRLALGEMIVVIIVGAGYRPEAYEGSRYIIERLKEWVPIWKQEIRRQKRCIGAWCMKDLPKFVRVAVCQLAPVLFDKATTVQIVAAIEEVARHGAELVVPRVLHTGISARFLVWIRGW